MTELQRLKIVHMFRVYDVDRDDQITWADFERYVHRLARLRGWAADHPAYRQILAREAEHWRHMRDPGDPGGHGRVSLEAYRAYTARRLGAGAEAVDRTADLWFAAFHDDRNGRVTAAEYRVVLQAYGIDTANAEACFRRFDLDQDGFLSRDDVRALNRQFWFSEDLSEPGHYLLGPVEGLPGVDAPARAA